MCIVAGGGGWRVIILLFLSGVVWGELAIKTSNCREASLPREALYLFLNIQHNILSSILTMLKGKKRRKFEIIRSSFKILKRWKSTKPLPL